MIVFKWMILVLPVFEMAGQTQPAVSIQVHPQVAGRSIRGQPRSSRGDGSTSLQLRNAAGRCRSSWAVAAQTCP